MEKFEYSGLLILFFVPTFWALFAQFRKEIKKQIKLILAMTLFGALGYFIVIPYGAAIGAWGYDYTKTWNIRMGMDLLETYIWTIAGCIILAILVGCLAEREDKNAYKKILKKTQGAWAKEDFSWIEKRRKIELKAAKERKKS